MKVFELPTLSGAERLFAYLFRVTDLSEIPSDVEETMEKALASLSERRREVIRLYFMDGMTIGEIAKKLKVDRKLVESVFDSTITVLKGRAKESYIKRGEKYYQAKRFKRLQDEIAFEETEIAKLEAALEKLKDKKSGLKEEILKELKIKNFEEVEEILDSDRMPVTELGVSKRTLTALYYGRVNTVGDLRKLSKKELDRIYGLGKKGLEELKQSVKEKTGVPLKLPYETGENE